MKTNNLAFFSVLFNPTENVFNNIVYALDEGYHVIVYLNKVSEEHKIKLRELGVVILGDNKNAGLGKAFFECENYLIENNINLFLYFDQDTLVKPHVFHTIKENCAEDLNEYGMVFYTSYEISNFNPYAVTSSGCLFSISQNGKFFFHDPNYFVECVDYEYCFRMKVENKKIKMKQIKGIDHHSLQDNSVTCFLGKEISYRVYPSARITDYNKASVKLLKYLFCNNQIRLFLFKFKSLLLMNIINLRSRFIRRFLC